MFTCENVTTKNVSSVVFGGTSVVGIRGWCDGARCGVLGAERGARNLIPSTPSAISDGRPGRSVAGDCLGRFAMADTEREEARGEAAQRKEATPIEAWKAKAKKSLIASFIVWLFVALYDPVNPTPLIAASGWFSLSIVAYMAVTLLDAYGRTYRR